MLRGNAPATVDERGRLKVPSLFRTDVEDTWGSDFYVTSISGESVRMYPLPIWQDIEEHLAKSTSINPTKRRFLNRTNYYGQLASMDKQGRILIPPMLRESARMVGEVAVLGNLNYLEVWNNEFFKQRLDSEPFTEDDEIELGRLLS